MNLTKTSVTSSPTYTEEKKDSFIPENTDQKLIQWAYQNEFKHIETSLNERYHNIFEVKDKRFYTLLHIACLNNQLDLFNFLFDYIIQNKHGIPKESKQDPEQMTLKIKQWVNLKTDEGFTPIHFASFRGNLEMLEKLEKCQANIYEENNQGLNVLHIASQGDQPISLAYFQNRQGMNFNSLDKKGSTPLHWASYLGCENSVNFLTTYGGEINLPDEEGSLTPLHLAVISGNSRVVRKLLIKGSDRNAKDKQNKTAMDLAKENDYNNIITLLKDERGLSEFFNIKPSFKPNRKKKRSLALFFTLWLPSSIVAYLFCFPYFWEEEFYYVSFALFGLALIFFLCSWLRDPGYIQNGNNYTLLALLKDYGCNSVCLDCKIVKPARSKHCEICHKCVMVYDHHCPWINNCVGAKNHRFFFFFITFIWFYLLWFIVILAIHIREKDLTISILTIIPQYIDFDLDTLYYIKISLSSVIIVVALAFICPLTVLFWIQINNFLLNKTTSERFGFNANRTNSNRSYSSETNSTFLDQNKAEKKANRSFFLNTYGRNVKAMCCSNGKNSEYSYIKLKE